MSLKSFTHPVRMTHPSIPSQEGTLTRGVFQGIVDVAWLSFFLLICWEHGFSQTLDTTHAIISDKINFSVSSLDTTIHLPHQFIIENSDTVWMDTFYLKRGEGYRIDDRFGIVKFNPTVIMNGRFQNDSTGVKAKHTIEIKYKALPFSFKEKYLHREIVYEKDTLKNNRSKSTK